MLAALCIAFNLWCADSETPPPTAIQPDVRWPQIVSLPLVRLPISRPQIAKPTGFPADCERQPPVKWQHIYVSAARRYGVDACALAILTWCESNFDTRAVSRVGAKGLPQLMDPTARELGVTNSFDPTQSIPAAARYLEWVRSRWSPADRTKDEVDGLGYCSWNWGDGNCKKDQARNGWYHLAEALPHFPGETQGFIRCNQTATRS